MNIAPSTLRVEVLVGDCRVRLRDLPDGHFHTCATSPPYWGLRDYGLPPVVWGGDSICEHEWGAAVSRLQGRWGHHPAGNVTEEAPSRGLMCSRCDAWCGCLGLEPTPELYVEHLVEVFREVWRVLRDDGTLWLNLGDTYAGSGGAGGDYNPGGLREGQPRWRQQASFRRDRRAREDDPHKGAAGYKPKDLVGIPWMVAFALRADGWYLRRDIIWAKKQPMPESVRDRCTTAHEYVFHLTKAERYFYDAEAVAEGASTTSHGGGSETTKRAYLQACGRDDGNGCLAVAAVSTRNRRSVWTIGAEPFRGAHFATYPTALPEICVLAGSSPYACPDCGGPWERVMEKVGKFQRRWSLANAEGSPYEKQGNTQTVTRTAGWRPTCSCYDEHYQAYPRPRSSRKRAQQDAQHCWFARARLRPGKAEWGTTACRVLDPFAGSGSTGAAAVRNGREFVGCEMSESYAQMARDRMAPLVAQGRLEL